MTSVMVAGYAVYKGREVFAALASRMAALPALNVRLYLDVRRPAGDTTVESEVVQRFAHQFRTREWPGGRLPEIYYDPRGLEIDPARRAAMHAKCVVVDRSSLFVSSANFTEAAQLRNIEVGLRVDAPPLASRLVDHFDALVARGLLRQVPL